MDGWHCTGRTFADSVHVCAFAYLPMGICVGAWYGACVPTSWLVAFSKTIVHMADSKLNLFVFGFTSSLGAPNIKQDPALYFERQSSSILGSKGSNHQLLREIDFNDLGRPHH